MMAGYPKLAWENPAYTTNPSGRPSDASDARIEDSEDITSGSVNRLTVNELYPEPGALPGPVVQARELLTRTLDHVSSALKAADEDPIAADNELLHALVTCSRAFRLFSIGEGWGMLVQGSLSALENAKGRPLEPKQIVALKTLIRKAIDEPYLSEDLAETTLNTAESAGLVLYPMGTEVLDDWLNG